MDTTSTGETELDTRIRQQEVVAELGQRALETDDLDRLIHDASVAVADALGNEYCKVLELLPGGEEVFLRRGVGWREGLVGNATVPTDRDSQAGYTLLSEEPVVVEDLRTEERFSGPELLTSHDVVSGISVVIGSVEEPWGVLGTHTTERREFDEADAAFVKNVANVLAEAIENEETKRQLREEIDKREARERKLERYETIVETVDDGIYAVDSDARFVMVNEAFCEMTGYDREDLVGSHATTVHADEITPRAEALAEEIAAGERDVATITLDLETSSGETIPVETRLAPLSVDGEYGRCGVVRDVTERTKRERELARFERAVEASGHAIYMTDARGEITYVNQAFEETTGYPAEEVIGKTPNVLHSGEHDDAYYRELWETIRAGEVWEEEITDRRKDGERYHAEQTIAPVTDERGEIDRFVAVQNDITERKERERALEESERRYRTLVEHFPNGAVALFDDDLRYTAAGGELMDAAGVDPEQRIGDSVYDAYPDEIVEEVEPYFRAALDGDANSFEVDYHGRHLFAYTLPVRNAADEIYAGMLVVQDVTERREYQRRLEESNERLEQFAYAASHDLQEPLRMVSSYLQLLERRYADELDEDAEEFIEFAVDGAERMRSMIDGLLQYSRVETAGDEFESVDLETVFEDVREDLRVKIEERDAEITADSLPRVEGDAGQLRQVFQNLLSNAIEYTGKGAPRVHVSAERNGSEWTVSVTDEGIGIDPDDQERVFEVFQRLHDSTKFSGTGLGLALCERIVERHDGDIWVESDPGEGATFSFTLPAVGERSTD